MALFVCPFFFSFQVSGLRSFFARFAKYIPSGMLKYCIPKRRKQKIDMKAKKKYKEAIHKHKKKQTQKHNEDNHCHVSTCIDVGRCCGPPYANLALQNRV